MESISTDKAPSAIGPYSQAIRSGDLLFISGQIPLDPATGEIVSKSLDDQTHQVMRNLGAVLNAAGADFESLIKTTIFLTDINEFPAVNEIYGSYLPEPYPARSTIEVSALPKGALIEIEAVARLEE
jgi:2-iminobutanoate/2-iminopropanoate deaminase